MFRASPGVVVMGVESVYDKLYVLGVGFKAVCRVVVEKRKPVFK
jgi:hypothetical protein